MIMENHFYVFNHTFFNSLQVNQMIIDDNWVWDYVYIDPFVYHLSPNRLFIVNQKEDKAEIVEKINGLMISLCLLTNKELIQEVILIALKMDRQ